MDVLTAEDIKFLRQLGDELKTQNNHGNRTPIFFQVRESEKIWGIEPDYADGTAVFFDGPETPIFTVEEAKTKLIDTYQIVPERIAGLESFDDVQEFCEDEKIKCLIGGYRDSVKLVGIFHFNVGP